MSPYIQYPKHNHDEEQRGFTADEIRRGIHTLFIDYECSHCGKVQSLANMGGQGAPCIRCGKKSS